ncbi:MAG: hypothetical protein WA364_30225 [Candidatus Nitrosopolaris sp.]
MIKQIAMVAILGLALILATAVYTQSAFASSRGSTGVSTSKVLGGTAHGLATACAANPNVASHNPNC